MKRAINLFLMSVVLVMCFTVSVFAAETTYDLSVAGDNSVIATYDDTTYTLTISGTGATKDFTSTNNSMKSIFSNVKSVVIEEGITYLGDYLFSYSSGSYVYGLNLNSATFTLPSTLQGIGSYTFRGMSSTADTFEIIIPKNVETIGESAFKSSKFSSINFEANSKLTSIPESAFYFAEKLVEITIPNGVTSIGNSAFRSCSALTSVTLPASVTSIGTNAFDSSKISSFICTSPNYTFATTTFKSMGSSATGKTATIHANQVYLKAMLESNGFDVTTVGSQTISPVNSYPTDRKVEVGASPNYSDIIAYVNDYTGVVDVIGTGATRSSSTGNAILKDYASVIKILNFHEGITTINYRFLSYTSASKLESINFPQSLKTIESNAFVSMGSSLLTEITIPKNVESIGNSAFSSNSLQSIVFEEGSKLTSIGNTAFGENKKLTSVVIPEGCTSIGSNAFYRCDNLESVVLPSTVTTVGDGAFREDYKISSFTWKVEQLYDVGRPFTYAGNSSYNMGKNATNKVAYIKAGQQYLKDSFEYLGYTVIEEGSSSMTKWESYPTNRIAEIGSDIKIYYNQTTEISDVIGTGVFGARDTDSGLSSNTRVINFHDGITEINSCPYSNDYDYKGVEELNLPSTLKTIGSYAFRWIGYSTDGTVNINIPEGVETINNGAFYQGRYSNVTIPKSVTTIGSDAFGSHYKPTSGTSEIVNYSTASQTLDSKPYGNTSNLNSFDTVKLYSTNETLNTYLLDSGTTAQIVYLDNAESPTLSGTLENGIEWSYDPATKTLTFIGDGNIPDYTDGNQPWYAAASQNGGVGTYKFGDGITGIGNGTFSNYGSGTGGFSIYGPSGIDYAGAGGGGGSYVGTVDGSSGGGGSSSGEGGSGSGSGSGESSTLPLDKDTMIILDAEPTNFMVTVPIKIDAVMSADGTITTGSDYYVENACAWGPVIIKEINVIPETNWSIVTWGADFANMKASTKNFGMTINGSEVAATSGAVSLNSSLSSVIKYQSRKELTFDLRLPAQRAALTENIAAVVFTVDFDKV